MQALCGRLGPLTCHECDDELKNAYAELELEAVKGGRSGPCSSLQLACISKEEEDFPSHPATAACPSLQPVRASTASNSPFLQ